MASSLQFRNDGFQLILKGVGVSVETLEMGVRIFVGIQKDLGTALEFIAGTGVWFEFQDGFPE